MSAIRFKNVTHDSFHKNCEPQFVVIVWLLLNAAQCEIGYFQQHENAMRHHLTDHGRLIMIAHALVVVAPK